MTPSSNKLPPVLTRAASQNLRAWPHLRILYVLADNYAYFKENRVNKFTNLELADKCGVERQQIAKSLRYLREKHFLIKIGGDEYINPLYCYQCGPVVLKELIETIVDEGTYSHNGKLIKKPSYWPPNYLDFRNVSPAKE